MKQERPSPHAPAPAPAALAPASPRRSRLPWLVIPFSLCLMAALTMGLIAYLETLEQSQRVVAAVEDLFSKENITETFVNRQLEARSTGGAVLEVATATSVENFSRKSSLKLWDRTLPLGTTISEISVPATYRYHINLNDSWELDVEDGTCFVTAPSFKASLPVAIDTAGLEKKSTNGWARFDKAENLVALEQSLTHQLAARALSRTNQELVREAARESVGTFVRNWLLGENRWGAESGSFDRVIVRFRDESPHDRDRPADSDARPAIVLHREAS